MSFPEGVIKLIHHSPSEEAKLYPCYVHALGWRNYEPNYGNQRTKGEWYDYQIQLVVKGKGYLWWKGELYSLECGDVFFIDLSQSSHYYADEKDPWEAIWIHFGGNQADFFYQLFRNDRPVLSLAEPETFQLMLKQMFEQYENASIGNELLAASTLVTLMSMLVVGQMRATSPAKSNGMQHRETIAKAISYIEAHVSESITIDDISKAVAISSFYLSRLFSAYTSYTIKEYILKYRLISAKQLLANTELTLLEIADLCGFSDQSHLGRAFRKYEKTTPKKYRMLATTR
jgi:AraC-like DNA-binding protein